VAVAEDAARRKLALGCKPTEVNIKDEEVPLILLRL
jgi:hypothetical protein